MHVLGKIFMFHEEESKLNTKIQGSLVYKQHKDSHFTTNLDVVGYVPVGVEILSEPELF